MFFRPAIVGHQFSQHPNIAAGRQLSFRTEEFKSIMLASRDVNPSACRLNISADQMKAVADDAGG